eukprot:5738523-Ditylum_brightwellii.AAC.1
MTEHWLSSIPRRDPVQQSMTESCLKIRSSFKIEEEDDNNNNKEEEDLQDLLAPNMTQTISIMSASRKESAIDLVNEVSDSESDSSDSVFETMSFKKVKKATAKKV